MALVSVVSILPAGKHDEEYAVPLSANGQLPATHYGKHAWEEAPPIAKTDETVQARFDTFSKREILKHPLEETEKTGRESFRQIVASMGLRQIVVTEDAKGAEIDPKAEAPAEIKGAVEP
jgi:hypothetical protein